jgi:hypothetical protein
VGHGIPLLFPPSRSLTFASFLVCCIIPVLFFPPSALGLVSLNAFCPPPLPPLKSPSSGFAHFGNGHVRAHIMRTNIYCNQEVTTTQFSSYYMITRKSIQWEPSSFMRTEERGNMTLMGGFCNFANRISAP